MRKMQQRSEIRDVDHADWDRSACLCGVGAPDLVAAVCVTETGDTSLWLISQRAYADPADLDSVGGLVVPSHERTGRLPGHVRDKLFGDALRCGAARSNGEPCRHRVAEPGRHCVAHSPNGGAW